LKAADLLGAWSTTLALTLTNPMTILAFVAIFAGAGLATASGDTLAALLLVAGVFLGSAAWWLLLSGGVALLRGFVNAQTLRWINWIAGRGHCGVWRDCDSARDWVGVDWRLERDWGRRDLHRSAQISNL
jgi:hypothetical protein